MLCTHRHAVHALSRTTPVVYCSKGFGAAAPKQKGGKASKGTAKTPQQVGITDAPFSHMLHAHAGISIINVR
jgi:hypothetical protein